MSRDAGSDQERWLHNDLAQNPSACTLAFWHRALFSSGEVREVAEVRPLWRDLYDFNTDLVVNEHVHHYERFAPQNPDGAVDTDHGILQFTIGSGGRDLEGLFPVRENSLVRLSHHFAVLTLELGSNNYVCSDILNGGSGQCHQKHPANAK